MLEFVMKAFKILESCYTLWIKETPTKQSRSPQNWWWPLQLGFVAKGPSRESFEYSNASSSFASCTSSSWSTFHLIWTTREKKCQSYHKIQPWGYIMLLLLFFFIHRKLKMSLLKPGQLPFVWTFLFLFCFLIYTRGHIFSHGRIT